MTDAPGVLDSPARRGGNPRQVRSDAVIAARQGRFDHAVHAWRAYDRQAGITGTDLLLYGRVLEQCGEIATALAAYGRFPRSGAEPHGLMAEASLHVRLGHRLLARQSLDAAVEASLGSGFEVSARRGRAVQALAAGRLADALADYVALDRLAPHDPTGLVGQIDVHLQHRDDALVRAALQLAAHRFPDTPDFIEREARFLNQAGTDDEILGFARRLRASGLPPDKIVPVVGTLVGGRSHYFAIPFQRRFLSCFRGMPGSRMVVEILRPQEGKAEATLAAAQLDLEKCGRWVDSPAGIRARTILAQRLVGAARPAEAAAIVDGLERSVRNWPYTPPVIGPIREWKMVTDGAVAEAQQSYWTRRRMIAGRDRTHELSPVRVPHGTPPPVTVFCQLRNEIVLLPHFFRHYRGLGVERFVMVDNASDDGSFEWLRDQPDVELYRTSSSFRRAEAGNAWINPLIGRPEYAQTLCLRVDADEHLVYPHFETRPMATLWRHMQDRKEDVLYGHMLDMMPDRLSSLDAPDADITTVARYFEAPPPPSSFFLCPYWRYAGGPRSRLLDVKPQHLTKSSGLRGGGRIEQISASHLVSPARVASVGMVLLHYKFRPDFFERARRIADEHQYAVASQEFARYRELESRRDELLLGEDTREYLGSASLVSHGVLRSTAAWDDAA